MQTAFGITEEDVKIIIETMADEGKEATFSMGEDTPLAFISQKPRVLYDYFKQRFAQVTNPPIDPLREGLVMSLDAHLGKKGNILDPKPEEARQIKLASQVLNEENI
jgi:glutamate synthase (ferredoxin)